MRASVDLDWGPVSYLEWAGNEPRSTVLLLHGGGVDGAELSWGALGPAVAERGYRVLAPDHPGYGSSPAAPWPSTQDRLVRYVGEFAAALGLHGYIVGGLSLGGGMTIGHVLQQPEKVSGAMLLGSYGIMRRLSDGPLSLPRQALTCALVRTGLLAAATRRLAASRTAMDWSLASLVRDPARRTGALRDDVAAAGLRGNGLDQFAQWQRDQVGWTELTTDYTADLPLFPVPALLLHGDRDGAVPVAHARIAADLIPNAHLQVLAGAGHWVQRDRPDEVAAAVLGFLNARAV